jgi:hypothetical protein
MVAKSGHICRVWAGLTVVKEGSLESQRAIGSLSEYHPVALSERKTEAVALGPSRRKGW